MNALAVIGCGNMGEALVRGVLARGVLPPSAVRVAERQDAVRGRLAEELGVTVCDRIAEALEGADVVLIAVKPQGISEVLGEIAQVPGERVVLSVAAGVTVATLEAALGAGCEVVRAMPNTPAMLGCGAAAYALGTRAGQRGREAAQAVLGSVGLALEVPEDALDGVTALSGSGPAYVFLMLEGLIAGGVAVGLEPEIARRLAEQTLLGGARMARETGVAPEVLRARVTSPGGTTAAAVAVLEAGGWNALLRAAIEAARARAGELSRGPSAR